MDYALIETFIVVCEVRNLTKAANLLYKTQPTISNRIVMLEKFLGFSLFTRHKGKQEVELTPKGENFLPIAKQLFILYREIEAENSTTANTLTVSTTSSYKIPIATDICKLLLKNGQDKIILYTYQTTESYNLIANKKVDVALVSRRENVQGVNCETMFGEKYFVVKYNKKPAKIKRISTKHLDIHKEIFQHWDNDFDLWHRHCFNNEQPIIQIDSCNALKEFLYDTDYWTIIQSSSLFSLQKEISLQLYELTDPPPERKCYLLTNTFADKSNLYLVKKFKELLKMYAVENAYCEKI